MKSPTLAIMWQEWTRVRVLYIVFLAITLFMCLLSSLGEPEATAVFMLGSGFVLIPTLLLYYPVQSKADQLVFRLPPHLLRAPVSAFRITLAVTLFNILAVTVWCLVLSVFLGFALSDIRAVIPDELLVQSSPRLMGLLSLLWMNLAFLFLSQAAVWLLGRIHVLFSLVVIVYALAGILMSLVESRFNMRFFLQSLQYWTLLAVGSFLICWFSVARSRRTTAGRPAFAMLLRVPAAIASAFVGGGRRRPFRSARHAQLWYEWRRREYLLPVTVGVIYLSATLVTLAFEQQGSVSVLIATLMFSFVAAALVTLLRLAVGASQDNAWQKNFLFVRPASTRWFASSRLITTTTSAMLTTAIIFAAILAVAVYDKGEDMLMSSQAQTVALFSPSDYPAPDQIVPNGEIQNISYATPYELLKKVAHPFLTGSFFVYWLLSLSGALLPVGVSGIFLPLAVVETETWSRLDTFYFFAYLVMVFCLSVWCIAAAKRRNLLLGGAFLPAILTAGVVFLFPAFASHDFSNSMRLWYGNPRAVMLTIVYIPAVLSPFAAVPLWLNWQRHRPQIKLPALLRKLKNVVPVLLIAALLATPSVYAQNAPVSLDTLLRKLEQPRSAEFAQGRKTGTATPQEEAQRLANGTWQQENGTVAVEGVRFQIHYKNERRLTTVSDNVVETLDYMQRAAAPRGLVMERDTFKDLGSVSWFLGFVPDSQMLTSSLAKRLREAPPDSVRITEVPGPLVQLDAQIKNMAYTLQFDPAKDYSIVAERFARISDGEKASFEFRTDYMNYEQRDGKWLMTAAAATESNGDTPERVECTFKFDPTPQPVQMKWIPGSVVYVYEPNAVVYVVGSDGNMRRPYGTDAAGELAAASVGIALALLGMGAAAKYS